LSGTARLGIKSPDVLPVHGGAMVTMWLSVETVQCGLNCLRQSADGFSTQRSSGTHAVAGFRRPARPRGPRRHRVCSTSMPMLGGFPAGKPDSIRPLFSLKAPDPDAAGRRAAAAPFDPFAGGRRVRPRRAKPAVGQVKTVGRRFRLSSEAPAPPQGPPQPRCRRPAGRRDSSMRRRSP